MGRPSPKVAHKRAKLAAEKRHHPERDHTELERELTFAKLEHQIDDVVGGMTPREVDRAWSEHWRILDDAALRRAAILLGLPEAVARQAAS